MPMRSEDIHALNVRLDHAIDAVYTCEGRLPMIGDQPTTEDSYEQSIRRSLLEIRDRLHSIKHRVTFIKAGTG